MVSNTLKILFTFFVILHCREIPVCKLTHPKPFTVIRSNQIRLKAEPLSNIKTPVACIFFASYEDETGQVIRDFIVGRQERPPYEKVWICDFILDQSWLALYYRMEDQNNNHLPCSSEITYVVLDRNTNINPFTLAAHHVDQNLTIDGKNIEWPNIPFATFSSSDNVTQVQSTWNDSCLYFFIKVKDEFLYCRPDSLRTPLIVQDVQQRKASIYDLWNDDNIELCFDLENNKNSLLDTMDIEILICPDNSYHAVKRDFSSENPVKKLCAPNTMVKVKLQGTLNSHSDKDNGFTIEMAILWEDLGIRPKSGLTLGFDLFNVDIEGQDQGKIFSSLSSVKSCNNDNPSEWGNLELKAPLVTKGLTIGILLALIIIFCIVLFIRHIKFSKGAIKEEASSQTVIMIKQYVNENFNNEKLNLDALAKELGFSAKYLSRTFKQETGQNFTQYLNEMRVKAAKEMLQNPQINVSEVAFKAGFASIPHFNRVFKSILKMSPSQFRQSAIHR